MGVSGIYCFIHRESGTCYVGSSINIGKRRKEHLLDSRRGSRIRIHHYLRHFGELAFDFEILERCSQESLLERERFYIVLLNASSIDGFNSRDNPCATYNFKASPATCARISASKKGRRPTPPQIENQIAGQVGLKRTQETRMKMSMSANGKTFSPGASGETCRFS